MPTVCIMNETQNIHTQKKTETMNYDSTIYNKWNENAVRFHHVKCCRDHKGIFFSTYKVEKFIGRMQKW